MAGLGSVGSGLDPATTAQQLVAAERAVADNRLARTETKIKAEVSAVATLRSAMSALQSALRTLAAPAASQPRSVGLSSAGAFTATAASGAPTGQFEVEVQQLARAQKLASGPFDTAAASVVGTGTLSISAGAHQFDIEIVAGKNSLGDIRDAINAQAAGKGVQATLVNGDGGTRLVLSAVDSGTANTITVSANGGDGGLAQLSTGAGMTSLVAAQDAMVVVDGITRTSASNTITDLLPGISFTLTEAKPGTTVQMNVGIDTAAQLASVKTFVEKYNAALSTTASLTSYNAATQTAAVLNGDSMVRSLTRELRDMVGGEVTMLKDMGIAIAKDGKLTLNEADFTAAVARDPSVVGKGFGTGDTLGAKLNGTMTSLLAADGPLKTRDDSLTQRTKTLTQQRDALDRRMSLAEARYKAQFIALDTLVTKLQSSSNFLSQQLSSSTSAT
ncbi:Flagellar hook-associated protein 2 [Luteimonas sp. 9C]|uniref:flagellar filament capping protein FliD n=1 Tax=Luteimonas sp. 9C TaxID=2653148 RepID=UPI0012F211EA|nr:flagellar filament capping protein FliD [Luteimonas sp. 9C]VXC07395.1 Flagellar hook-associated protein 2 [Luteimonas sp. 9C]